jgi:indole-3-glycerol phosphate synthase/phosphoribosylanthranilate isomerase
MTEAVSGSGTILDRIVAATRHDLAERRARISLEELHARATSAPAPRPFAAALRPDADGPARLIAEVKRASPSKGLLAEAFDPEARARAYESGAAAAVSVLTEPHFFRGSLDHLRDVRATVGIPVLRKDFLVDPYQVYEARAAGADAVLLICALLDDEQLEQMLALTRELGMEALVEAHSEEEVRRAVVAGAGVVGVNSRDLRTFAVDPAVVRRLRPLVPADRVFVAESGIADWQGAAHARAWGADAILVGEALMRAADQRVKAHELATAPGGAIAAFFAGMGRPFIKICGLTAPEQAAHVARLGADAFGLVFAPSRRRVTPDQACEILGALTPRPPSPQGKGEENLPRAIGVFVNEPASDIARIAEHVGLDAVQLSGDETPEACTEVAAATNLPVVKALRLRTADDLDLLDAYVRAGVIPLLDTPSRDGSYGGTGQTGDWELARQIAACWPVILSGGLTPENVAEALAAVGPRGVDVSSGVETGGTKDLAKVGAFITAARGSGGSIYN